MKKKGKMLYTFGKRNVKVYLFFYCFLRSTEEYRKPSIFGEVDPVPGKLVQKFFFVIKKKKLGYISF